MIKELYIQGQSVDTKELSITRKYTSPFFSDCTNVYSDGTYTVKLPKTAKNLSILDYYDRGDSQSDAPYSTLKASYYVNGLPIFENADCIILPDSEEIELQFTWGISRAKYLPLFSKKVNEIIPNGTTILESDWIVAWNKTQMYASGKKYKYIDYLSAELVQDVETINGVKQRPTQAPEPYKSNLKEMTLHPFIEYSNIIDLICHDNGLETSEFDRVKANLTNMGLILGGDNANKTYTASGSASGTSILTVGRPTILPIPSLNAMVIGGLNKVKINQNILGLSGTKFSLSFSIVTLKQIAAVTAVESGTDFTTVSTPVLYTTVNNGSNYTTTFTFDIDLTDSNQGHEYSFSVMPKYTVHDTTPFTFEMTNNLSVSYTLKNSVFSLETTGGLYDCLLNLPDITQMDFIKQMLIITGMWIGYDVDGNIKLYSFSDLTDNYEAGNIIDWTGRISKTQKGTYKFNSNCQKNWIKYNNSDDIKTYVNKGSILVNDTTLDSERDLYKLSFDLADRSSDGRSEFLLYTVTIKKTTSGTSVTTEFGISYNSKNSVSVYNDNGIARNEQILPNDTGSIFGFISKYYPIYKKLVARPNIKTIEINLDFFESATLDLAKPVYIRDKWGRYGLVLDVTCPDGEVSVASVLIVDSAIKIVRTTTYEWINPICELVYNETPPKTLNLVSIGGASIVSVTGTKWYLGFSLQQPSASELTVVAETNLGTLTFNIPLGSKGGLFSEYLQTVQPITSATITSITPDTDSVYTYVY